MILQAEGLRKMYGEFCALDGVSLAVDAGEFVSIVGPNGAGKTTLVNLLTGLLVPTNSEVYFKGENIAGVGPVALATRGMARTFQLVQVFPQLTVAETIGAAVVTHQGKVMNRRKVAGLGAAFELAGRRGAAKHNRPPALTDVLGDA